jgi:hypothetical protein
MRTKMLWIVAFFAMFGSGLCAQDISGDWQGTLEGAQELRVIVHVEKGDTGAWKGTLTSIDQGSDLGSRCAG